MKTMKTLGQAIALMGLCLVTTGCNTDGIDRCKEVALGAEAASLPLEGRPALLGYGVPLPGPDEALRCCDS